MALAKHCTSYNRISRLKTVALETNLKRIVLVRFDVSQPTETIVAIECTDFGQILAGQFKVEHLSVFLDSLRSDRFRNDHQTSLNLEANQHLRDRFVVLFTDLLQSRILQQRRVTCLCPRTIRRTCQQRIESNRTISQ